jgi:Xylosyltransferase C terminal
VIIKQLEEWLFDSKSDDTVSINSYWQSLYHQHDKSPQNDDTIMTAGHSLARIAVKTLCPTKIASLIEMTTYMHDDTYMVVLISNAMS